MLKKIESLRKQSKEVRNRYAFWCALLFTVVVTVFWVSSLPARMQVFTGAVPAKDTEGGFSRMWQGVKASVIERTQGTPIIDAAPLNEVRQVSVDEFMASSSTKIKNVEAPVGRPILIGTSTQKHSTSTNR